MSEDSANVYHLVAFVLEGKDAAKQMLKEAKKDKDFDGMKIINSVVIRKDEVGKIKFSDVKGMSKKKGMGYGAGAGLILGILGSGGLLLPVLVGGAAGSAVAQRSDKKTLAKEMSEVTEAMGNDSSAVMVLLEDKDTEAMIDEMDGFNANIITVTLGDEESQIVESMIAGEFEIDSEEIED